MLHLLDQYTFLYPSVHTATPPLSRGPQIPAQSPASSCHPLPITHELVDITQR